MVEAIVVEGLIYGIMVLGVFITFRIMDFPDLTVDGSFSLGAAIMAIGLIEHVNPLLVVFLVFLGGVIAGTTTALIHNWLRVPNLLAGILTMTMLYSINIRIMDNRSNLPLLRTDTILTLLQQFAERHSLSFLVVEIIFFAVVALLFKSLLDLFFRTDLGVTIGAMGNNEQMVISQGVNPKTLKVIGLAVSNGLVAISGALAAQYLGFADVGLGTGTIISGLASILLGEFLFRSNRIGLLTFRALLGSILFRGVMFLPREFGFDLGLRATDIKLEMGILIIGLLIVTQLRKPTKRKKATA